MRVVNFAYLLAASADPRHTHPMATALRAATTVELPAEGVEGAKPSVHVSMPRYREGLVAAGLEVVDDEAASSQHGFRRLENLTRVLVLEGGAVVAMGAAGDEHEALMHAALGWFREHPLPGEEAPAGVATTPG